jgi:hypothetical protein
MACGMDDLCTMKIKRAPTFRMLFVLLFAMLGAPPLRAQENGAVLPDTFHVRPPGVLHYVTDTLGLGRAVDQWPLLGAVLLEAEAEWYGTNYVLAMKGADGYTLLNLIGNSHAQQVEVTWVDVNGSGPPELVVRYETYSGHSGWEHAIHEREWTLAIWDIHATVCLFEFQYITSVVEWWTEFAVDTTETLRYEEREVLDSGGENSYERFDVQVERERITILGPYDEAGEKLDGATVEEYRPFAQGWVRVSP